MKFQKIIGNKKKITFLRTRRIKFSTENTFEKTEVTKK